MILISFICIYLNKKCLVFAVDLYNVYAELGFGVCLWYFFGIFFEFFLHVSFNAFYVFAQIFIIMKNRKNYLYPEHHSNRLLRLEVDIRVLEKVQITHVYAHWKSAKVIIYKYIPYIQIVYTHTYIHVESITLTITTVRLCVCVCYRLNNKQKYSYNDSFGNLYTTAYIHTIHYILHIDLCVCYMCQCFIVWIVLGKLTVKSYNILRI